MHVGSNQISFINQLVTFVELHKRTSNRLKATTILLLSFFPLPLTAVEEIIPPSVALMHTFPLPPHRRGRGSLEGGARRPHLHGTWHVSSASLFPAYTPLLISDEQEAWQLKWAGARKRERLWMNPRDPGAGQAGGHARAH